MVLVHYSNVCFEELFQHIISNAVLTQLDATSGEDVENTLNDIEGVGNTNKYKEIQPNANNCTFLTFGRLSPGICTYYGACRVDSTDYMYQGGCGELSLWGEGKIEKQEVGKCVIETCYYYLIISQQSCSVWVEEMSMNHGSCTEDGHCITEGIHR